MINFQFRAEDDGYVGLAFKYMDENNYYTFEMGCGDDMRKRFFQIRRKLDSSWSVLKRFNTNDEINQLPFFGCEINSWYAISVEIKSCQATVYASILGVTAVMEVMRINDCSISTGRIGLATAGTRVSFAEISIRPIPIPYSIINFN